jgi:thioredoxin-related protein
MSAALTPARELTAMLKRAAAREFVVLGFYTSHSCPWCVAIRREQLEPRLRSADLPKVTIIEFDADSDAAFTLPDGRRQTARQWAHGLGFRLTPTLAVLDRTAKPIISPLVGYSSRDFYGAYLEEQIRQAQLYWQNLR